MLIILTQYYRMIRLLHATGSLQNSLGLYDDFVLPARDTLIYSWMLWHSFVFETSISKQEMPLMSIASATITSCRNLLHPATEPDFSTERYHSSVRSFSSWQ